MILKYQTPAEEGAPKGFPKSTHVISGIDRYEFGYSPNPEEGHALDLHISYHLEKETDKSTQYTDRAVTIYPGCSAFMMNDEGKTIERIR